MRFPLIASLAFHLVILLVMTVGFDILPRRDFEIPDEITVELVDISEKTETTKIEKPPQKKIEKPAEEKTVKEEPKKTPPKAIAKPSAPTEPEVAELTVPDKSDKKKEEKKQEPPKKVKPKPPVKKPALKDTNKQNPENVKEGDFTSVLKNLLGEQPQEEAAKAEEEKKTVGQMASLGDRMTISETDALRRQLEQCWNVPIGAREAQDLVVDIELNVNRDRTVRDARIVDRKRYAEDPFFRAAADSALRAVLSDDCNPLALPAEKYDQWKSMTFRFNPQEMF